MSTSEGWDGTTSQGPPPYVPEDSSAATSSTESSPGPERTPKRTGSSASGRNPYVLRRALVGFLALLVVVAVWAVATRGSDNDGSGDAAAKGKQRTASMTSVEVMSVDPQFATFAKLLKKSGLESKMDNEKEYTFLAPSSAAFTSMDQAVLAEITKDPKGKLAATIGRHVIAGKMKAADLAKLNGKKVTTISGAKLAVTLTDGGVAVGGVRLAKFDIDAERAEIHVLDSVIPAPG